MITQFFVNIIIIIVSTIFSIFPVVSLASFGSVGVSIESTILFVVQMWNAFLITFPYGQIAWTMFLTVVIPFEITMLVLKFFLGSRTPSI